MGRTIPNKWKTTTQKSKEGSTGSTSEGVSAQDIAKRAYEKFISRGGWHGEDWKDWLEAEQELKAKPKNLKK